MSITKMFVRCVTIQSPGPAFMPRSQVEGLQRALSACFPALQPLCRKAIDTINPSPFEMRQALVAVVVKADKTGQPTYSQSHRVIEGAGGMAVCAMFTRENATERQISLVYGECRFFYTEHCCDGQWRPMANQRPVPAAHCMPEVYAAA